MKKLFLPISICVLVIIAIYIATMTKEEHKEDLDYAQTQEVVTLLNYLNVYPNDIGNFLANPTNAINAINSNGDFGYNDWRLPTREEMALIHANSKKIYGLTKEDYMTSDGLSSGNVRLVCTGKTVAEKERLKQQQEAEQRWIAEAQRIEEQAGQTELAKKQAEKEEEYKKGLDSYNKQDYTRAVYWYRKAAEQENADAQTALGSCYYSGYGVRQDYTQAVYWWRKAAEQGDTDGLVSLGICFYAGHGVRQDYTQAVFLWRKAAEQGNAYAQGKLGFCYSKGWGVSQDYTQAVYWFRKAAEQGDVLVQVSLGICYSKGWGVSQDYTQAVYWFRKAAERGDANAQFSLGGCYYFGDGVNQDYTQAKCWFRKAAEQGNVYAKRFLKEFFGE